LSSKVEVRIFKFNPLRDKSSRFDVYTIDRIGMIRASDLLDYVYENFDRNLAYRRHLCRFGVCSACRVRVNGHPCLPCLTALNESARYVIEPVAGYQIVRDLVVDYSKPLKEQVTRVGPRATDSRPPTQLG
jgi:succinate dehydrogenase/fumarate reductase-like Fe-S protein